MKALCVDVDGLWPNVALMKWSRFHREQGDEVELLRLTKYWKRRFGKAVNMRIYPRNMKVDKAYVSCIFTKNKTYAFSVGKMLEMLGAQVEIGGAGIDLENKLPEYVEHLMPDYDLYPEVDYSIGYTSRGCSRKGPWCIVWRKEGPIREHADLKEFLDPRHRKVILLDSNLLAAPNWEKVLIDLIAKRVKVCFTQGLDIRLVDDANSKLLRLCKYSDSEWQRRRLYFSFDLPQIEDEVIKGINILKKHGIQPTSLTIYMLVGYRIKPADYTLEHFLRYDYHRFQVLRRLKTLPYIMVWNNRKDIPLLQAFKRWVNLGLYKKYRFKHEHVITSKV